MSAKRINATIDRRGNVKVRLNGRTIPFVTAFTSDSDQDGGSLVTLKIDPGSVDVNGHSEVEVDADSVAGLLDLGFISAAEHEKVVRSVREEAVRGATAQIGKDLDELRETVESVRADAAQAAADRDTQAEANAVLEQTIAEQREQLNAIGRERDAAQAEVKRLQKALEKEGG